VHGTRVSGDAGVTRLLKRRRVDLHAAGTFEATWRRRVGAPGRRDSRTGAAAPPDGNRETEAGVWGPGPGEKDGARSYPYRIWCPGFRVEAQLMKGREGSRQSGPVTLEEGLALACVGWNWRLGAGSDGLPKT